MIRGPVLPQLRASLWAIVRERLDAIESGLSLVLEGLDCTEDQLGLVDGLARDAMGEPVLVLLAVEGDALLAARTLAASEFVHRVGGSLARAVPEGCFRSGAAGRVLVVGTEAASGALETARRLPVTGLHVCALEPFRIAGTERFAVRWLRSEFQQAAGAFAVGAGPVALTAPAERPADAASAPPEFVVSATRLELWRMLRDICQRIDADVQLDGDRYSRRITWQGHVLGEVRAIDGALLAGAATGVVRDLREPRDVRWYGDQLLRAFARESGIEPVADREQTDVVRSPDASGVPRFSAAPRHAVHGRRNAGSDNLRATLAAARLSPEEYSALGAPATSVDDAAEGSVVAQDGTQSSVGEIGPGAIGPR